MSVAVERGAALPVLPAGPATHSTRVAPPARTGGVWPHTDRWLPWLLAGFLAMLWLMPIDAIVLPVPLPVDANPDRVLLMLIGLIWVASLLGARSSGRPVFRTNPVAPAVLIFFAVALVSVLVNLQSLVTLGEFELGAKKVAILCTYFFLFFVVATVVRPSEVRNFTILIVVLASIMAVGIIFEYRTNINPFNLAWRAILESIPGVSAPIDPGDPEFGRRLITGPTAHAIAAAAILGMALPFAFSGYLRAKVTKHRVLYALAIALLLTGCISTIRKTGLVTPISAMLVLILYRPRSMIRLIPLGVVIILGIQVISPSALTNVKSQFVGGFFQQSSVEGRTDDYPAIKADISKYMAIGRGQGTWDPDRYRYLDNEYLQRLIETGVVGLGAYLLVILSVARLGHRTSRSRDPSHATIGVGAVAVAAVFAVASGTYDQLSFPQAPYLFFFVAGLAVVSASAVKSASAVETEPSPAEDGEASPPDETESTVMLNTAAGGASDSPDMSIVMVTHDGREKALATLSSARAATAGITTEWIVYDGGSTDGTPQAIAEKWPDIRLIRGENVGFAAGNNAALARVRGRYFLLLNPDVEVADGKLAHLVTLMDHLPKVAAASVVQTAPGGKPRPSIGRFPTVGRQLGEALGLGRFPGLRSLQEQETRTRRYSRERSADWLVGAFLCLRSEAVAQIGGLDEDFFLYCEEKDWCLRARRKGWDVRHFPIMTVIHHTGGYDRPGLASQLTHSKLLFARKHFGPVKRAGIQAALTLRHALRVALFAPAALLAKKNRSRLEIQLDALAVARGRSTPAIAGRSSTTDIVTAEEVRIHVETQLRHDGSRKAAERTRRAPCGGQDAHMYRIESRISTIAETQAQLTELLNEKVGSQTAVTREMQEKLDELERLVREQQQLSQPPQGPTDDDEPRRQCRGD